MAQDTFVYSESVTVGATMSAATANATTGSITTLTAPTATITTGNVTTANLTNITGGINGGTAGASVTTSGTINTSKLVSKVTTGSAVTAVIMGSGTVDGQLVFVEHVGAAASSITFATAGSAAGSSHIATDFVFSGQKAAAFIWEATTALWFPVSY
jgi:hypothetical protein